MSETDKDLRTPTREEFIRMVNEIRADNPPTKTEYQEYHQSPDMSDSQMLEVIKDYIALGWSAAEYSWKDGIKTWIFQKG